jgi:hypothetical protein
MRWIVILGLLAGGVAHADEQPPLERQSQIQIDAGLSVIGAGFEVPIGQRFAVQAEAFVFGTYFLPWFDLGDRVAGVGGGVRVTRFARADGKGLYLAPYVRVMGVGEGIADFDGTAITAGAFLGWAFRLGKKWDLRLGGGAQWIYVDAGELDASTPFVAIDGVIGYRL